MNCRDVQNELSAYVDGELPPSVRVDVEAHIAACARCQQHVAELRQLSTGVAALTKLQPAPQFLARVREKIARGEKPEPKTWHEILFRPFWLKVPLEALALFLIYLGLTALFPPAVTELASRKKRVAMNEATAPVGEHTANDERTFKPDLRKDRAESMVTPSLAPSAPRPLELGPELSKSEVAQAPQDHFAVDGKAALSAGGTLIVSNNAAVYFTAEQPKETMVVEGDDVAAVQQQAETIAAPLQGRVTSAAQLGQRVQNIYVELPEENVAAFKSQFDAAQSLKNKLAFKEQSRVQDADKAAAALSAPTGALRDGGKVGEVVRQKQKAVTKVVEIQVVPPSGQ